ncbi:MAG: LacX protein [Microbacteriaceae bacterium]|nr:LacX protein [Microbacteriaceae bacterium]
MVMVSSILDNGSLRVAINPVGAELQSLTDRKGREYLWQGGEAWPRRAPILFPIVGRMPHDELVVDGRSYRIHQHGFARDMVFAITEESITGALFTLRDTAESLAQFPFPFTLTVRYALEGERLGVLTTVTNTGTEAFSASLGEHPGFAWPLVDSIPRNWHSLEFPHDEAEPIRRVDAHGLLRDETFPTPVSGRTLSLNEELFDDDAVIFDKLRSRSVRYSAPDGPSVTVDFDDFPFLGVWSRKPGDFICIEPWFGMAAPEGFSGDYAAKPGQFSLAPGDVLSFAHGITLSPA